MRRRQRVHRAVCPGCRREVAYSRGLHEFADSAYLRRHKRADGAWCDRHEVPFASLERVS